MERLSLSIKNKFIIFITLSLSLILLVTIFIYFIRNSDNFERVKTKTFKNKPTISIEPLHFSQEGENKNKFILSADSAKFFQEEGKGVLKNFSLVYIYNSGKKLTISGDSAVAEINADKDLSVDINLANIYSLGKVYAISSEGYRFETEKLFWDGSKKVITTKEPVILYGDKFRLTGEGLKADLNDEKMEIVSKVSVMTTPEALSNFMSKEPYLKKSSFGKM